MELEKILEKLQTYHPEVAVKVDAPAYIETHRRLSPTQRFLYPQCLYVGNLSEFPPHLDSASMNNIIGIADQAVPAEYLTYENLNLIVIDPVYQALDVLDTLADIMIDEAKLVADMRRLIDALYSNLGIQYMVDIAAELFGNPILINDVTYKILAMSQKDAFTDDTLAAAQDLGYVHEVNFSYMKKDRVFEQMKNLDYPFLSTSTKDNTNWLFRSIKIHNLEVGHVAVVETNHPFREIDYELLDRFSKLIAIEMEKSDFYKSNKGVMFNYLLSDLLSGKMQNKKSLQQRLGYLEWKMYRYFQVLVIFDHDEINFDTRVQQIGEEIRSIIPDCRWTVHQKNIVVLLNRSEEALLSEKEQNILKNFLDANSLSAGVSNAYSSIFETRKHYLEALRALEMGLYTSRTKGYFLYDDYVFAYIANVISKRNNLMDFIHPAVKFLYHYDQENNTQFLETLNQHLFFVNQPVAAAESLHIHRNTLLYRINRIKELTKIDLDNGDVRLKLQSSLKFLEYHQGNWE